MKRIRTRAVVGWEVFIFGLLVQRVVELELELELVGMDPGCWGPPSSVRGSSYGKQAIQIGELMHERFLEYMYYGNFVTELFRLP